MPAGTLNTPPPPVSVATTRTTNRRAPLDGRRPQSGSLALPVNVMRVTGPVAAAAGTARAAATGVDGGRVVGAGMVYRSVPPDPLLREKRISVPSGDQEGNMLSTLGSLVRLVA